MQPVAARWAGPDERSGEMSGLELVRGITSVGAAVNRGFADDHRALRITNCAGDAPGGLGLSKGKNGEQCAQECGELQHESGGNIHG